MFRTRKKAIIGGAVLAVAVGFGCSWAFVLNAESGSVAGTGGTWENVPVLTLVIALFGVIYAFFQTYMLFAIKQLGNRMTQMDTRLTTQIIELAKRMNERFVIIEGRFTQMEGRFAHLENRMDARFAQMDARFAQLEGRFVQIEDRFAHLENRMDARFTQMEGRFTQIDIRLDSLLRNQVDDGKYSLREE